ncbi:hypothetical protein HQ312_19475 [Rhodococcus sp. BP-316]|uniref:hypothetical protein n=1 Tax=Rhodococcus sp. BP-316 TaxID=2739445 RepID=UPI001C9B21D8|nr:hypothetical protein [Rhodococcus sp. BP-316]MBY6683244.1 hypothetical protein [Rhodococcus sp. BP-316]
MIRLYNPLPVTLRHYEDEFRSVLEQAGICHEVVHEEADQRTSKFDKARRAMRIIIGRWSAQPNEQVSATIVLWPLFGYFDILTWVRLSARRPVAIIVHDPTPLRPQIGMGRPGIAALRLASKFLNVRFVSHTELAANALERATGMKSIIARHPIAVPVVALRSGTDRQPVRVLGQYKTARDLSVLEALAQDGTCNNEVLEIHGRGWPIVRGWTVRDEFVPEEDFTRLITSSSCIVIPYAHFYQSGIAVRALENSVPVVGPRHEHLETLYGRDWPGLVDDNNTWSMAMRAVVEHENDTLPGRAAKYRAEACVDWGNLAELLVSDWRGDDG